MGITTVKLISQKLLKKKQFKWFKPVYPQLSDISDLQNRHGHIKIQFSIIICKINFKDYLDKYSNTYIFHVRQ